MMLNRVYRLLLILFGTIAILSLILAANLGAPWQMVFAIGAGGAMSLFASMVVHMFAAREQDRIIKSLTIDAAGIQELPEAFQRLRWLAFGAKHESPEGKETSWVVASLSKLGGSGKRFVTYEISVPNLINEQVRYRATFVGLQGCIFAAVTRESEASSCFVFDTLVPDAGVFFGVGYLTDWSADRDITLSMLGTGLPPDTTNLPRGIKAAFTRWYEKVTWDVKSAYENILRAANGGQAGDGEPGASE